jgi:ATP-dependent DNA helicase RecG
MYPDRLAVRNPGGLFGPVSVDALGEEGLSSSRNATLLKLLEDVTLHDWTHTVCEHRGSGIRSMLDALRKAGMNPPRFDDRVSSFTVTFPNRSLLSEEAIAWLGSLNQTGLSDSQRLSLVVFRDEPEFDNRAYREATRVDSRIATAGLQDMVARGLLEQTGSRRWARYKVREAPQPSRQRADRRPEILAALGDSTMSRSDLANATGLSDPVVRYWLGRMREEGMVDLVGTSPRSKYAGYRRNSQNPLFEG